MWFEKAGEHLFGVSGADVGGVCYFMFVVQTMQTIAATAAMEVSAVGFGAMVAASMMDMTGLAASGALAIGGQSCVLKYAI